MKCPHCTVRIHDDPRIQYIGEDKDGHWAIMKRICPACLRLILTLQQGDAPDFRTATTGQQVFVQFAIVRSERMVRPKVSARQPCPPEVPTSVSADFIEACTVLPDSAKAAAALGRRCLQTLLRDTVKVKPGNLSDEIQQVLDSGKLPSGLHESIDAIRNIGNFAAHPMKSTNTGMILDVEPGEAEWTLDVLEELFDFYFVLPETIKKKKEAFNKKLQEAGKPPIK